MKLLKLSVLLSMVLLVTTGLVACENGNDNGPDFDEEVAQTWEDMRDSFIDEVEGEINELEEKIAELRDENGDEDVIDEAENKLSELREKLSEAREAGEQEWQDMEMRINEMLDDLDEFFEDIL